MMKINKINDLSEFRRSIAASSGLTIVDFFATWCAPCIQIAPKIENLSQQYPNVKFYKVDVDLSIDIAEQEGISAMPTFVFYKNGSRVDTVVGANLSEIKYKLQQHA
jgi:thioredoxin 1